MTRMLAVSVPDAPAVGLLVVTGTGLPAPGAHTRLAVRIIDLVKQFGFWAVSLQSSKFRNSHSRYVEFKDAFGRTWCIRISCHLRPVRASIPHLDLVSADGTEGFDQAREFLGMVAAGDVPWFDSAATAARISQPDRKRIDRCR